jgi:hypothetical protein
VVVEDIEDNPGFFRVKLYAVPHFQGRDGRQPVAGFPDAESEIVRREESGMKIYRPLWNEGLTVPQQFQQQAEWEFRSAGASALASPFPGAWKRLSLMTVFYRPV